ncbi:MAG: hypothetical protein HY652_10205 [Acidobacteria bacterium]|nr:hypothetical protein [Acidobacteriota bacterium]
MEGAGDELIFNRGAGSWIEQAAREADRILNFGARGLASLESDLGRAYDDYIPEEKKYALNVMRMPFYTPEQLASSWVDFPDELFLAIGKKVWERFINAKKWVLTDEWGTHIEWTLDEKHWEDMPASRGNNSNTIPNASYVHPNVRPVMNQNPDMKGVIVAKTVDGAVIPELRVYVEKATVTKIEGGGAVGERFRQALERYKNIQFPGFPLPGVGHIEEMALGTHPKARPDQGPGFRGFGEGRRRSGTVHFGFGATRNKETREVLMKGTSGLPRGQHRDLQIYFPTLIIDGEKLVDRGHLTVLDDPEIRKVAAKYGNPDELLREEWIPPLDFSQLVK